MPKPERILYHYPPIFKSISINTHPQPHFIGGMIHPSQRNVGLEQNLSACHQSTVSTMKIDNNKLFLIRPFGQNLEPF